MTRAQIRWTKRCDNGAECVCRGMDAEPQGSYVPDDQDVCDPCLLAEYDLVWHATTNPCDDPLGIVSLYPEEYVLAALRKARAR